ncbi:ATP-binding protein [Aquimarina sp. D1M17]|uniref:sensor histidine kinase n=1 Tax=Aquimarina acroporae TaxID=2937283 RepID=UPI0020BFFD0A|nr:ATP-binding protein [Aquimarina acroporae]MCK8521348.1 ATP-binding protein [Aquimarina acroporae]
MDIGKNIADILQLYEFSMAIGKSLDYEKNCDKFLTLLLARKNLSGCCILRKRDEHYEKLYAFPAASVSNKYIPHNQFLTSCFKNSEPKTGIFNDSIKKTVPMCTEKGAWVYFNLKEDLGLFLFENNGNLFTSIDINQLNPIIAKFSLSLDACESFSKQQDLLKKLTSQNQELKEYAHVISHDLKSPLRNVVTLIAWTKEDAGNLDENLLQNLTGIEENAEKMDNLINGLLTYSTIDKEDIVANHIDIKPFIQEIIESINDSKKEITTFNIHTNVESLNFNALQFKQLFFHLISNAIYSIDKENGVINIHIDQHDSILKCSVQDNGKGIAKRYFDKIFEIFQTLENDKKSTGVGLSIVKKIIELYEGKIWLESQENMGTSFHFTLKT